MIATLPNMAASESSSRVSQLHDTIRAEILNGDIKPGAPLRLATFANRHGVSMAVVREALTRLAEHNLAVLTPNQGFRVVEVSEEDLLAITELRSMLEPTALLRAMEFGDVSWEAGIVSAHHVLERAHFKLDDATGSTQEWSTAHAEFHLALIAACDNPRMLSISNSLRDSAELYRQLTDGRSHSGARDVAGEHRELMELAIARDPAAADALRRHIQITTDALIASKVLTNR